MAPVWILVALFTVKSPKRVLLPITPLTVILPVPDSKVRLPLPSILLLNKMLPPAKGPVLTIRLLLTKTLPLIVISVSAVMMLLFRLVVGAFSVTVASPVPVMD